MLKRAFPCTHLLLECRCSLQSPCQPPASIIPESKKKMRTNVECTSITHQLYRVGSGVQFWSGVHNEKCRAFYCILDGIEKRVLELVLVKTFESCKRLAASAERSAVVVQPRERRDPALRPLLCRPFNDIIACTHRHLRMQMQAFFRSSETHVHRHIPQHGNKNVTANTDG